MKGIRVNGLNEIYPYQLLQQLDGSGSKEQPRGPMAKDGPVSAALVVLSCLSCLAGVE
jgi:hypothetical protein